MVLADQSIAKAASAVATILELCDDCKALKPEVKPQPKKIKKEMAVSYESKRNVQSFRPYS